MGRGREEEKEMEKREGAQWQGGSNMMQTIWRRERRLPAQPALFKLGRKWPYIQHASNLALPSNTHTLSVLRSVAGHWLRIVFVIIILCFFTSPLRPPPPLLSLFLLLQSMRLGGKHEGKDKGAQGDEGDEEEEDGTEKYKTEHEGGWEVSVFPQHPSMT